MHDDNARAAGATYIGPRAFAIAFCAVCGLFLAIVLGFNHATAFFDVAQPEPVAAVPELQSEVVQSGTASALTNTATGAPASGVENPALMATSPPEQPRPLLPTLGYTDRPSVAARKSWPIVRLGSAPVVAVQPTPLPQRKSASVGERKPTPMVDHTSEMSERKPPRAPEQASTPVPERNLTSRVGHTLSPGHKSSPTAAGKLTSAAELKPASAAAPQPALRAVTKPASLAAPKPGAVAVTKPTSLAGPKPGAVAVAKTGAPAERKSAAPIALRMTQRKPAIAPPAVSTERRTEMERRTEPVLVPAAAAGGSTSLLVPLKSATGPPSSNGLQPARVERGALLITPAGQ